MKGPATSLLTIGAMTLAIALLDYWTGYEINVAVFYFAPVALAAWRHSRTIAFVAALVCAVIWYVVDDATGHTYSYPIVGVWNACIRMASFCTVTALVSAIRTRHTTIVSLNGLLGEKLGALQRATEEIKKLQSDIQMVCAWSKRIQFQGRWMEFDEFLKHNLHVNISHGMSREVFDALSREYRKQHPDGRREPLHSP